MRRNRDQVTVRKDDIDLFSYLHASKIARTDQIHRDVWKQKSEAAVYKRLWRLERQKYVKGSISNESSRKKAFHLMKKSFDSYLSNGEDYRIELKSDSVAHDLELVDIRSKFNMFHECESYLSENELQTWRTSNSTFPVVEPFVELNSDGAILLQIAGAKKIVAAVEFEAARKFANRYREILSRYYSEGRIAIVLYIFSDISVLKRVRREEEKMFKNEEEPKFFYIALNELKQKSTLKFINWRREFITIEKCRIKDNTVQPPSSAGHSKIELEDCTAPKLKNFLQMKADR